MCVQMSIENLKRVDIIYLLSATSELHDTIRLRDKLHASHIAFCFMHSKHILPNLHRAT